MFKSGITLITCILLIVFTTSGSGLFAQPPPPPPSQGHGLGSDNPPGSGAPIGDGMFLLLGLAGLYSVKKIYAHRTELKANS